MLRGMAVKDDYLKRALEGKESLLFDGAMGTMLQSAGLAIGNSPEQFNLEQPTVVSDIHAAYVAAGSQVVTTNTFGANARNLGSKEEVAHVFHAAIACARASGAPYVAADIGPIDTLLEPLGTLTYDEAHGLFKDQMVAAQEGGVDIVLIETMSDLKEAEMALITAKEYTNLPVFVTMTFDESGHTYFGIDAKMAAETLKELGADAVGINCSLGPESLIPHAKTMLAQVDIPVIVQANAGLPSVESDGSLAYHIEVGQYCDAVREMLDAGVTMVGGCCGTTPKYIEALASLLGETASSK